VTISTDASLREMIAPGALVMLSPIICGFLFGKPKFQFNCNYFHAKL
jgi:Na+/H+-translocating membrane pyrophosphatase